MTKKASATGLQTGFQNFLVYLKTERALAANTIDAYERDLGAYLAWLDGEGVTDPGRIERAHLRGWADVLGRRKLSARTIARRYSSPTLTSILPTFWPLNSPMNASGAFSIPSATVSRSIT